MAPSRSGPIHKRRWAFNGPLRMANAASGQVSFKEPSARRRMTLSPVLFHTIPARPHTGGLGDQRDRRIELRAGMQQHVRTR
jgi:hypothetical protein